MNTTLLKNWSGLVSIVWMVGLYEIMVHLPDDYAPSFDLAWHGLMIFLGVWLGVGLYFAVMGLRCRAVAGQLCAVVAIFVFVYFAWHLLYPSEVPSMKAMRPNQSPEPTAIVAPVASHVASWRWLSFHR